MKMFTVITAMLMSAQVYAVDFVIEKNHGGGYMMPEWLNFSTCSINANQVINTYKSSFYKVDLETVQPVALSGGVIDMIKAAALEPWQSTGALCDAPYTGITAQYSENGKNIEVELERHSTCSSKDGRREGPATAHLLKIIEKLCQN